MLFADHPKLRPLLLRGEFGLEDKVQAVLDFEEDKLLYPEHCYAWQVRQQYTGGYVKKGLTLARARQEEVVHV